MNGRSFLTLAGKLLADSTEEAWRSAVSRAYYAAFHVARQLLLELGFTVPRGDRAHGYLWLRLSNSGDSKTQIAGRDLKDLRSDRNRADYDIGVPLTHRLAGDQVQAANAIVQKLDAANTEPTRTQITDAIRIYERDVLRDVTWCP